ncbi:serine threonine-kinase EDR1 isoform X1 isoform A [Micractinium conductrix]|uniref:Serine threonine-kinase EDR1 isoform X1 isoform A n=1 Tax=Micractinium conductrix TaxID=554055 RepID=A0A2P6VF75_9CHLO|nr:serine threonine-kinase EDR1 isoform X1 isoform A [Micractinium conductrix]|eukprot:PSC72746.1 serine threonine-kinase EDR1 isoform X1 isoform A [Micractinium conductrix]
MRCCPMSGSMPPRGVHATARAGAGLLLTAALCVAVVAAHGAGAGPTVPPRPRSSSREGHAQAGTAAPESLDLEELWCRYGLAACSDASLRAAAAVAAAGGRPAGLPPLTVEGMPAHTVPEEAASEDTLTALIDAAFGRAIADAAAQQPATRLVAALAGGAGSTPDATPIGSAGGAAAVPGRPARLLQSLVDGGMVAAGAAAAAGTAAGPATGMAATAVDAALSALDLVASSPQLALALFVGKLLVSALAVLLWRRRQRRRPLRHGAEQAVASPVLAAAPATAAAAPTATSLSTPAATPAGMLAAEPSPSAGELKLRQLFGGAHRPGLLARLGSDVAAELASPNSTGSPRSPGGGSGSPLDLSVNPSVRGRNAALKGWADVPAHRDAYRNPLFASPDGQLATVWGGQELPSSSHPPHNEEGEEGAAGAAGTAGGAGWKAKQQAAAAAAAASAHDPSLDAEDSFKLLAAELPATSSTLAAAQAALGGGGSSRRPSADLPSPSSPGKAAGSPRKQAGGAARKLTAAHSVGPQDLSALEEAQEAAEEGAGHGSAARQAQRASAAGSLQAEPAASGSPRLAQLQLLRSPTLGGGVSRTQSVGSPMHGASCRLRLLTPQQFQEEVQLGQVVGAGAAGCVYEATWGGRRVAVKLLHPSTADEKALAREVETMAAVGKCPYIVRVLGACLEPPHLALIQELAATSLHDELHKRHRRPLYGTLLQLAEDIAMALDHCHSQRPPLVHRDLSAKNVLLGLDGRARLADFGLAAARRRSFLSADKAGALGTPQYMAPEAMQAGPISERCDVYSYAILLWEMLTGHEAWAELASPYAIIYAVGVERRRLPIPPGCPPALANLLKECWRHNGPLRPSFQEVLARLRTIRSQDSFRAAKLSPSRAETPTGSPTASMASTRTASLGTARRAKTSLFTPGSERGGTGSMRA